ncbi:DJ-1/PfpI family protein [Pantoea agglomerans]|jgi:putative intracellular protease/amidase|uniref:DJ-1/PfpI family protein n=2 Tax=Pantoea TaxID=53335 RepID=A0ACC5PI34_ENTAG|nr:MULTISPECIES: DJ-1/PfpI family protein [Pantoea]KAF6677566.1 DJ-1/PfpI family protein [Pantoea sp. EKM21T]KAF6683273.1 DJ-1/PfpI family protein [Pantoea sp. EKM22T]KJH61061.1 thiamine biosynthesis protein ThiJ [Pantoea agglomerans]KOA69886.1 thiamine biosynthesis protein ThiJ [Pantoea sp. CFSAN033090]MBD8124653.1 DJ-1/PfpI family protein [Pantoea agglomerans]
MDKNVALLLAPGFEEAEAIITLDILSRLGVQVTTLACQPYREVNSYHHVKVVADELLEANRDRLFDAVIVPGGPDGSKNLAANAAVIDFIRRHDEAGRLVCPICSAAARVLAPQGLLRGRRYVSSGTSSEGVTDGVYVNASVVKDGNLLSGQDLGAAFDFAFAIAFILTGDADSATEQAEHISHKLKVDFAKL